MSTATFEEELAAKAVVCKSYSRVLIPQDSGGFTALILEFPGCVTEADTLLEAWQKLHDCAFSWVLAALADKQQIPEPIENHWRSVKASPRKAEDESVALTADQQLLVERLSWALERAKLGKVSCFAGVISDGDRSYEHLWDQGDSELIVLVAAAQLERLKLKLLKV